MCVYLQYGICKQNHSPSFDKTIFLHVRTCIGLKAIFTIYSKTAWCKNKVWSCSKWPVQKTLEIKGCDQEMAVIV